MGKRMHAPRVKCPIVGRGGGSGCAAMTTKAPDGIAARRQCSEEVAVSAFNAVDPLFVTSIEKTMFGCILSCTGLHSRRVRAMPIRGLRSLWIRVGDTLVRIFWSSRRDRAVRLEERQPGVDVAEEFDRQAIIRAW